MKSITFLFIVHFIMGQAFAQSRSLQEYLIELQIRNALMNSGKEKNKKPFDANVACLQKYQEFKSIWNEKVTRKPIQIMRAGMMTKSFTRSQIESMANDNSRGLKYEIRGNDQHGDVSFVLGDAPPSPHSQPGCKTIFQENVSVIEVDGKKCREIKFTHPTFPQAYYFQVYCEDSKDFFLSFATTNDWPEKELFPFKDCINCIR